MKGRNDLKKWLKERISLDDDLVSTRFGNLHAKALDSNVEHPYHNKKNEVLKLVQQNSVLKTILCHEKKFPCHPCSANSRPIPLRTDQLDKRNLHLSEQFLYYQKSITFRDIIDDSVDEFKSTKDTIQADDSESESKEDRNMFSNVLNILMNKLCH